MGWTGERGSSLIFCFFAAGDNEEVSERGETVIEFEALWEIVFDGREERPVALPFAFVLFV